MIEQGLKRCETAAALLSGGVAVTSDATALCAVPYPGEDVRGFQGGCSDGKKYYYIAMMHYDFPSGQEDNYTRIAKVDLESGKVVKYSDALRLHHCNDLTYDPRRNCLIASHNRPHSERISFIDAETLTLLESRDLPFPIYAIEYHPERNGYVVGLSGTRKYRFLDKDMRPVDDRVFQFTPLTDRYTKQGVAADDRLIYFILWDGKHAKAEDFQNLIAVYNWDGEYCGLIEFDVGVKEPENISIVNGEILAVCGGSEPMIYRIVPKAKENI